MSVSDELFQRANEVSRRRAYLLWHRHQSKQQILRSQVGFSKPTCQRPEACIGCHHYHGVRYGRGAARTSLICAMHPFGWQAPPCPDWQASPQ